MVNDIEIIMRDIDKLMEQELFDESYEKYRLVDSNLNRVNYIQFGMKENEKEALAEFYSSYAYFLFSFGEYDQFFKMYIKAQKCGYSSEKRRKFLYETFVEPNMEKFKENYDNNIEKIRTNCSSDDIKEFEDLPYWLITTGEENEYYLYEKATDLIGRKISFEADKESLDIEVSEKSSDHVIIEDNCWSKTWSYIKAITSEDKKAYLITEDVEKLLSYFQGYNIEDKHLDGIFIFENMDSLESYFMNSSHYLPRGFIGREEEDVEYEKLIEKLHKHRLSDKTRKRDNVMLSICIPSFNRGHRAYDNVIHTLKSEFDEEIEIIVSNNGTKNQTKEYYDKISKMEDPRVTYFEFDENQGGTLNFCKVMDLANGKYAMLISDEDLVDLNELRSVINILQSKDDDISVVRTKTDGQGIVPFIGRKSCGKDALFTFMLSGNYMSGIIFNKMMIEKYHVTEYIRQNLDNFACTGYPHMVWELILYQYGSVIGLDMILINEGESEKLEATMASIGDTEEIVIPAYATLEYRLKQHKGFFYVIKELEISKNDFDVLRELYKRVCNKTIYLIGLSINVFYRKTDTNVLEILDSGHNYLIEYLDELYLDRKDNNKDKYLQDIESIRNIANIMKEQLKL